MDTSVFDSRWHGELIPHKKGPRIGYTSRDGQALIEIQRDMMGARDLHAGIMRLALSVARRPETKRACLVMVGPRLSRDRLIREWRTVMGLFAFDVAHRLSMVAVDRGGIWTEPEDENLQRIARALQPVVLQVSGSGAEETRAKPVVGQKPFEVVKVLLDRWFRREAAVPVGRLAEMAGCTYPTVTRALKRLERRRCLIRHSNRSVELAGFPHEAWSELIALCGTLRPSLRYVDVSGEKPDPEYLLKRLDRMKPPGVAVSGVIAARFWHPDFDLHGTPRLDLVLHAPRGRLDTAFMRRLDPALKRTESEGQSAMVVVHSLVRHDPLFEGDAGRKLPFADPVETALDLHEMGLTAQAGRLMSHLRPEAR